MSIKILMPALSPTMKSGNITKWYKKEGEKVKTGDIIADIETDKATMEFEYIDEDGIIAKIIAPEGAKGIAVNTLIALIAKEGEDIGTIDVDVKSVEESPDEQVNLSNNEVKTQEKEHLMKAEKNHQQENFEHSGRIKASPLAKRVASNQGVDLKQIQGTGPYNRIIKADVLDFINGNSNKIVKIREDGATRSDRNSFVEVSNVRKIIAQRLVESKQTIPHFYLTIDCKLDKLLSIRTEINNENNLGKITVNDFIIKAVAMAMAKLPMVNTSWIDGRVLQYSDIDLSVAVSLDEGLITPIVKNADKKTLSQISVEMKDLAARARDGKLKPEEFQGGSFTISNLGMFGIKEFSAIINPPQSCIMAVGKSEKRVIVENGNIEVAEIMTVTLSVDHRVVDGALAANFLAAFKNCIERPYLILI